MKCWGPTKQKRPTPGNTLHGEKIASCLPCQGRTSVNRGVKPSKSGDASISAPGPPPPHGGIGAMRGAASPKNPKDGTIAATLVMSGGFRLTVMSAYFPRRKRTLSSRSNFSFVNVPVYLGTETAQICLKIKSQKTSFRLVRSIDCVVYLVVYREGRKKSRLMLHILLCD